MEDTAQRRGLLLMIILTLSKPQDILNVLYFFDACFSMHGTAISVHFVKNLAEIDTIVGLTKTVSLLAAKAIYFELEKRAK